MIKLDYLLLLLVVSSILGFTTVESPTKDQKYCSEYLKNLELSHTDFLEKTAFSGRNSAHFVYQQTYKSVPVEQSYIYFHFHPNRPPQVINELHSIPPQFKVGSITDNSVIKKVGDSYFVLQKSVVTDSIQGTTTIRFWNNDTTFLEDGHIHKQAKDTGVSAAIFYPNPVVTSGEAYGNSLIDNNNRTSAALESQQYEVMLMLKKDSLTKNLSFDDEYISFRDISSPNFAIDANKLLSPINRSMPIFEAANVYYHINHFIRYLDTLGYASLVQPLYVDAHAFNGADNSAYTPYGLRHNLQFGTGGVDDAEDAQVIIHEFAHSLVHTASPYSRGTPERNSIEEGICDYLCMLYSNRLSGTNETKVFSWDGHNEFFSGFILNSKKNYTTDYVGNSNQDREIWSSVLYDIHQTLGEEISNTLIFEHLFYLTLRSTMPNLASDLLAIDEAMHNALNSYTLLTIFENHGIVPIDRFGSQYSNKKTALKGYLRVNKYGAAPFYQVIVNIASEYNLSVYSLDGKRLYGQDFLGYSCTIPQPITSTGKILVVNIIDLKDKKATPLRFKIYSN